MLELKNDRLLKSIRHQPLDRTPIWIMRQAGRYLPEYRKTRARAGSFMNLCQTPDLACEVTLQPLARYNLDAAIIFSDILTIPDAMGLGLKFIEGEGPHFDHPLTSLKAINQVVVPDLDKLRYVYDAIRLVKHELAMKVPLIGFCGSPFTLGAYMVEGKSVKGFPQFLKLLEEEPKSAHQLLSVLADAISAHLREQERAGADVLMIFDTWGGLLNQEQYELFSLSYMKQIIAELRAEKITAPIILFTKGSKKSWLIPMSETGCDMLGLDWEISLNEARTQVGHKIALQGNLNPSFLRESPDVIRGEVEKVLAAYGKGSGHVFNLGHGITPDVPPEHVQVLIEAVHEFSKPFHMS